MIISCYPRWPDPKNETKHIPQMGQWAENDAFVWQGLVWPEKGGGS